MTKSEIAELYGITTRSLYNWIVKLVKSGKVNFSVKDYIIINRGVLPPNIYNDILKALGEPKTVGNSEKK